MLTFLVSILFYSEFGNFVITFILLIMSVPDVFFFLKKRFVISKFDLYLYF
jgi:hypothetical protein